MKNIIIYLLIVMLFQNVSLISQTSDGKEFWLGFLENLIDTNKIETSVFISSNHDATGTLEIPCINLIYPFQVSKDSTIKITLSHEIVMAIGSGRIENKGIHIQSDKNISVFALNYKKYTSDATLVYPIDALDKEYTCIGYHSMDLSQVLIIATHDDTHVDILPGITKFEEISITLQKGQSYQFQVNGDITGARILSVDYPIAVFSGNRCTYVPSTIPACDHLFEQLPPSSAWGTNYGIIPLKTRKADSYKILSLYDNTDLFFDGEHITNLPGREFYLVVISKPTIVSSSKPILVAQFSHGQDFDNTNSDPFMILLPPLEQTRNKITFNAFTSSVIENYYLNILVNKSDLETLLIDSVSLFQSEFKPFPSNDDLLFAQLTISQGNHTISCGGDGFISSVYGYGNYESYGYNAGARIEKINQFKFRIGAFAHYGYILEENVSFLNFNQIPSCYRNYFEICDKNDFKVEKNKNVSIGGLVEIPSLLTTPFGVGVRGSLAYHELNFLKTEYAFENTALQRDLLNEAKVDLVSWNIYPYLIFTFVNGLNLYTGFSWSFNFYSDNLYEETIVESIIEDEIGEIIYQNNSIFYEYSKSIFSAVIGAGYEITLNEEKNLRLSPEIFYIYNFNSYSTQFNQFLHRFNFGLSFKWGY